MSGPAGANVGSSGQECWLERAQMSVERAGMLARAGVNVERAQRVERAHFSGPLGISSVVMSLSNMYSEYNSATRRLHNDIHTRTG